MELLVRYGEDNDLENGRLVFDYFADEFFAGTEEIVITPQSDPPLQAGTYFVSVGVLATGVEVNCTLTAEVEREGGTPPPTSDGTLTPSQPVSFQRGPVDNPTIFFGNLTRSGWRFPRTPPALPSRWNPMPTWSWLSAMARTTPLRIGVLSSLTTAPGTPRAMSGSSLPLAPTRRFDPEPTSYR